MSYSQKTISSAVSDKPVQRTAKRQNFTTVTWP